MSFHTKNIYEKTNHIEFELTQDEIALISKEDKLLLTRYNFHARHRKDGRCYIGYVDNFGKKKELHRLIMGFPDGFEIDHKNGNCLDNRRCNLRIVTRTENSRNQRVRNKFGVRGIRYHSKLDAFTATITGDNKKILNKSFACKKWGGKENALQLCKYWRIQKEKELGYLQPEQKPTPPPSDDVGSVLKNGQEASDSWFYTALKENLNESGPDWAFQFEIGGDMDDTGIHSWVS